MREGGREEVRYGVREGEEEEISSRGRVQRRKYYGKRKENYFTSTKRMKALKCKPSA